MLPESYKRSTLIVCQQNQIKQLYWYNVVISGKYGNKSFERQKLYI